MDVLTLMLMLCGVVVAALSVICLIIITRQQRTIDALTNKLMARDYGEYKRYSGTLMREERPERKPISFYDDPGIEDDVQ